MKPRALVCLLLLTGCEPRVEEPAPQPRPTMPIHIDASPLPQPSANPQRVEPPLSPSAFCMKPLPAEPERPERKGPAEGCPKDPGGAPKLDKTKITFPEAKFAIEAEVARELEHRARGLMYRRRLDDDAGMLFVFEDYKRHPFWMRNTCLSLDMIYLDRDKRIVGIEENTRPLDDSTYDPGCASAYVVEVAGGWSRRHGVKPGQKVEFTEQP